MRRNVSVSNTRHHLKQLTIVFALVWRNTCWPRAGSNPGPPSRTSCAPARCCARSGQCRCSRTGWPVGGRPPVSCHRSLENHDAVISSKMKGPGDSDLRSQAATWSFHTVEAPRRPFLTLNVKQKCCDSLTHSHCFESLMILAATMLRVSERPSRLTDYEARFDAFRKHRYIRQDGHSKFQVPLCFSSNECSGLPVTFKRAETQPWQRG